MFLHGGRRPPAFSIGIHLAVYGLTLVLPVLLYSGFVLRYFASSEKARLEAHALATARDLAAEIDRELAAQLTRLDVLAAVPGIAAQDAGIFDKLADRVRPALNSEIRLIDLSSDESEPQTTDWFEAAVERFRTRLVDDGLPVVSDLVLRSGEMPRFIVATPVRGSRSAGHAVAVALGPERLRALLRRAVTAEGWRMAIVDRAGVVIARSHEPDRYEGRTVPFRLTELSAGPSSVARTTGLDGAAVYRAHAHLTVAPWRVVVAVPTEVVEAPLRAAWRTFALAGSLLLTLSIVLAMMYGRALARPVRAIARAARDLGRGDINPVPRSMLVEINAVGDALDQAARQRRQFDDALETAHERIRLALRAGRMGTFEIDLKTGTVLTSPERLAIFDIPPENFDGRLQTLDGRIHPEDLPRVEARRREVETTGGAYEQEHRIVTSDGGVRWVLTRAEVRRGPEDEPGRVVGVTMDISARKSVEENLAVAAAQAARQLRELEALYASAPIGLALFDRNLRYMRVNDALAASMGVARTGHEGKTPAQVLGRLGSRIEDSLEHVLTTGTALLGVALEGETPREPGVTRAFSVHYYPIVDGGAGIAGVGLILEDVTEDHRAAERQKLLIRELRHRANNMLAVIQSVARRSLSGEVSLAAARTNFLERLQALARAHNMLTESDWRGVSLEDLIRFEIESLLDRVELKGPQITLDSGPAQTFALVIHELAVNAVKHGALSAESGKVQVTWNVRQSVGGPRFVFRWQESGGPSVVPPNRRGFGTELVERAIIEDFDKPARIEFAPDGLVFEIDVPFGTIRSP